MIKQKHLSKHTGVSTIRVEGFTLIELLVVIGIIGILAALILLAINPAEMQRKGRDATRFSDTTNLRKAIDLAITDGATLTGTTASPFTSDSGTDTRTANDDVNNYIRMDVSKYVAILPDDPQHEAGNTTDTVLISDGVTAITKDGMRYFFGSDGQYYEINTYLESASNNNKALNTSDGGSDNTRYEIGTDPGLNIL